MDLSIIIPVYNNEKYVARCLDSIFSQEFKGTFEVIAVDDASTDKSLNVLKEYRNREDRLKIIEHKTNRKQSIARASGMNASSGDYIMHVDSDDWLLPGALENLHSKIIKTKSDVLVFDIVRVNSTGNWIPVNLIRKEICTSDKIKVQNLFFGSSCNKIVRRSLIETLISGTTIGTNTTEDLLYTIEILLKSDMICTTRGTYYAYFINTESTTWTVKPDVYLDNQCIILSQLVKIIKHFNPEKLFVRNIFKYVEKLILLQTLTLFLIHRKSYNSWRLQKKELEPFREYDSSRFKNLITSFDNRTFLVIYSFRILGIRKTLSVLIRSLKTYGSR
jgi:glycosyltransferase involved in cell wall biosynthesis